MIMTIHYPAIYKEYP